MTDTDHQAEQHRLRRTTRHLILSLAAVAVFGMAFAGVYVWTVDRQVPPQPTPPPAPTATTVPLQETLLIQATTADGAVGNLLAAVSTDATSSVVFPLPAELVVTGPQAAPEPLRLTVAGLDTLRSSNAVAATLGVRVDAAWRIDRKALAGLVDSVDGLPVTVPESVRVRDEAGEVVATVRAGRQRLDGTTASWYAVGTVPRQTAAEATSRFTDVMTGALRRLPRSDVAIRESLTALGALAPSTIGTQELAVFLLDLSQSLTQEGATITELATTTTPVGEFEPEWLDYNRATPQLRRTVPYALWRTGVDGPARVLVSAIQVRPGRLAQASTRISAAGFVFVDGRGTPVPSGQTRTTVTARGTRAPAMQVEAALEIPDARTEVVPAGEPGRPWADVDVVLSGRSGE